MTISKHIKPTSSEMEVLQILWKSGPSSVKQVNTILNETRTVGYTTTLKIMQLMLDKRILSRNTSDKKHIYAPILEEESVKRNMLDKFLKGTFKGSAYNLVMEALGNYRASKDELESIKELIEKLEGGKK